MVRNAANPVPALFALLLAFCAARADAQVVYQAESRSAADKVVFVSDKPAEADWMIYKTEWKSDAKPNSGIWYFTEWRSEAQLAIWITNQRSEADWVICYTRNRSEAGPRKP
jgi:hypothetical protein